MSGGEVDKRSMGWFKIDDQSAFHAKVLTCGNEAWGAFCRMGAHCSGQMTDGFVAEHVAITIAPKKVIQSLLNVGLLHKEAGGYSIHDYLEYNPTREQELAKRAARAEAGRKGGLNSSQAKGQAKPQAIASPGAMANGQAIASANEKQNSTPSPYPRKGVYGDGDYTPNPPAEAGSGAEDSPEASGDVTISEAGEDTATSTLTGDPKPKANSRAAPAAAVVHRESKWSWLRCVPANLADHADRFERVFYPAYPRKEGPSPAWTAWRKLAREWTPELGEQIMASLAAYAACPQWQVKDKIPHPETWLNQRRWEGSPPTEDAAGVAHNAAKNGHSAYNPNGQHVNLATLHKSTVYREFQDDL